MVCQSRVRRHIAPAGLVVLLLGLGLGAHAQVTTELSDRSIAVGERVSYVITIDHEEPTDVEVSSPEFSGLRVVDGPTVRPVSLLAGTERQRAVEVRFTLEAVAPGRYVLPELPVSVAGQPYLTSPRLLEIGERTNRSRVPFLARWSGPTRPLSVGEARAYSLEIYNVPDYLYPSSISLSPPRNAIFEEVQGLGTIDQYVVDGVTLYAIPVAVFMVTASAPGTLLLPEAGITAGALDAVAPSIRVDVRELPEPVESSGAVGEFTYAVALEPSSLLRSESTELRIRVAGNGNLHFLGLPEPEIEGFQIERDETASSLTPHQYGYSGYVERTLTLRPGPDGPYRIAPGVLLYLDPSRAEIVRRTAAVPAPVVLDSNLPVSQAGERATIAILDRDELAAMERRVWYRDPLSYGWFAPGLLVLIASRIWRRRDVVTVLLLVCASFLSLGATSSRLPWSDLDRGYRRYEERNLPAAISAFERASRIVPDSPGVNHNLSILYFEVGDIPRSVLAAREAIRLAPFSARSRELLDTVERSTGIDRTVPPPHLFHPDFFFLLSAVLVNALLIGLSFKAGKRAWVVIARILFVLMIAGAATGLILTAIQHEQQLGVVRGSITLRRIPDPGSGGWLPVVSGSAVRVLARTGDSLLVQTVLGLEGWIDLDDLFWRPVPAFSIVRYRGFGL